MSGAQRDPERLSHLTAIIGGIEGTTVYGRVTAVRGLMVEVSGPISAMSLGGRVGIEIAAGTRIPCEVIGFSGDKALVMPFGGLDGVRRRQPVVLGKGLEYADERGAGAEHPEIGMKHGPYR